MLKIYLQEADLSINTSYSGIRRFLAFKTHFLFWKESPEICQYFRKLSWLKQRSIKVLLAVSLPFPPYMFSLSYSFLLVPGNFHWIKVGLFAWRLPPSPTERPLSTHPLLPAPVPAGQPPAPQLELPDLHHQQGSPLSPGRRSNWWWSRKQWGYKPFS